MKRIIGCVAAAALCAPLLASAAQGWVVADISLQAGPDTAYPSIVELRAGTPVSIQGCIDGWTWCDVSVGDAAGWVPGTFLEEDYGGQRVVVIDYGPRIGIPVVAFSLGVYWDRHYHSRPFYAQRQEWVSRSITPHAPPRPTGVAVSGARQAPATTATREQQRTPPVTTATTPTPTDRSTRTVRTQPVQEPAQQTGSANTTARQDPKAERAPAPVAQHEPKPAAPSDAAPQAKLPAEPPKAAPAQRTAMQQQPKAEQKPRSNEPKAKDELKAPPKKNDGDKKKDDDGGGGG
jgi:uncharacterized protein YraI